ncbi:MAG: hypothetical protein VKK04_11750 [Synechococcales bacterium]|nr:hypothetical protein [Synechococcales bacterium]
MNYDFVSGNGGPGNCGLPAPCIVDTGIVVNKQDMQRLLADLGAVRYVYTQDETVLAQGEGYVVEVFADPQQATLVTNQTLYLNVYSFDYLELSRSLEQEACFDLVQDSRQLRLIPLSNPLKERSDRTLNVAALEAVVAEVLSANLDVKMDEDDCFPF